MFFGNLIVFMSSGDLFSSTSFKTFAFRRNTTPGI